MNFMNESIKLFTCLLNMDIQVILLLIDRRAIIGAANGHELTALHLASSSGYSAVVSLLLDRRAINDTKMPVDSKLCIWLLVMDMKKWYPSC